MATTKKKPTKKATKARKIKERAVLITTANRGVFFGYTTDSTGETIRLLRARNVFYWATDTKARGFLGLAAFGPAPGSKVGPAAPALEVRNVTSVADCSPESVVKFEAASWG